MYIVTDRLCGLVVKVPGYKTEMYCVSCEVQTKFIHVKAMLGGIPVPTAWRVLGLRMEERPPDMEVSCEYIE
jgi:hypothetical protein